MMEGHNEELDLASDLMALGGDALEPLRLLLEVGLGQ